MRCSLLQLQLALAVFATAHTISIDVAGGQVELQGPSTETVGNCFWSGTSPFCSGECPSHHTNCFSDNCGDGKCCVTGEKKYCCLGACPPSIALDTHHVKHNKMEDRPNGPGYDYCPKDKVMVCPPGAEKNDVCLCIDKPDQEKKDL